MSTSGTRGEYVVDIWSGNHPFFQGSNNSVVLDEGRVNKFNKRFAGLHAALPQVPWKVHCCVPSISFRQFATPASATTCQLIVYPCIHAAITNARLVFNGLT